MGNAASLKKFNLGNYVHVSTRRLAPEVNTRSWQHILAAQVSNTSLQHMLAAEVGSRR
jgi:hypothetical protein